MTWNVNFGDVNYLDFDYSYILLGEQGAEFWKFTIYVSVFFTIFSKKTYFYYMRGCATEPGLFCKSPNPRPCSIFSYLFPDRV